MLTPLQANAYIGMILPAVPKQHPGAMEERRKRGRDARKVLVIGGTQFMGRTMVERLLKEGDDVTILNRGKTPSPFGESVHYIHCDRFNSRAEFKRCLVVSLPENDVCSLQGNWLQASTGLGRWWYRPPAHPSFEPPATVTTLAQVDFVCFGPKDVDDVVLSLSSPHSPPSYPLPPIPGIRSQGPLWPLHLHLNRLGLHGMCSCSAWGTCGRRGLTEPEP